MNPLIESQAREIRRLEDRVAELEYQIEQIIGAKGERARQITMALNIVAIPAAIVEEMLSGRIYSRDWLAERYLQPGSDSKGVEVYFSKLRRRFPWFQVTNRRNTGYQLTPETIAHIRSLITAKDASP